jgi:hypothetical protein
VTYCPLVTARATKIHKFQGFDAGFDPNDQFKHLIVNPGNLTTKQQNPGTLYAAMSHAKTMGQMTPNNPHPKDSVIFWTGLVICKNRVLTITKKRGLNGNITNCLKINKRQEWVNHLLEQSQLTSSGQYSERRINKIEKKMPKKLSLFERTIPSGGSIGRIRSRFGVGVRSSLWNWNVRNGRVLGEYSTYFRKASHRLSTGQEWDWHAPDLC